MRYEPYFNILGVHIAATDMEGALGYIRENIEQLSGNYICVSNVHTTIMSYEDKTYCSIQNHAAMALPDGRPLSIYARSHGCQTMERVTGPDLMCEFLESENGRGLKHFFYGGTEKTLEDLINKVQERNPHAEIAGWYSPPFRTLTEEEDREVVKKINEAEADIVWVGLGAPKQEIWMANHKDQVKGLMIGVGAAFDYYAGNIKRAPLFLQKTGLEWMFRLLQDPKRLWKRYFVTNTKFIWLIIVKKRKRK